MAQSSDLFLIAHKVRGEPAFDVAHKMTCPHCDKGKVSEEGTFEDEDCHECDSLGYWWIIPTSGHRAYPFFHIGLDEIEFEGNGNYSLSSELASMPDGLPDHYTTRAAPTLDLASALGIMRKLHAPTPPIKRRL